MATAEVATLKRHRWQGSRQDARCLCGWRRFRVGRKVFYFDGEGVEAKELGPCERPPRSRRRATQLDLFPNGEGAAEFGPWSPKR